VLDLGPSEEPITPELVQALEADEGNAAHLLDVNVLVALVRPKHSHHAKVLSWFKSKGRRSWATCAFTEAALVTVLTNPRFTAEALSVGEALQLVSELRSLPGHEFWPLDFGSAEGGVALLAGGEFGDHGIAL
jgi:predicted nucleic acid-binding protein